jgi:hypothetical protein
MKSMKYTVEVDPGEEDETLSLDSITDWIKAEGDTDFGANAELNVSHCYALVTQAAPGGVLTVGLKTKTELALVEPVSSALEDDKYYTVMAFYMTDVAGGTLNGAAQQYQLTGKELKENTIFNLIPNSSFITVGLNSTITAAMCNQTGLANVFICQPIEASNERVRITGAVDLVGAIKVAAWAVTVSFSEWAGAVTPFFSNTIGNLFTDNKLADYVSKKK